MVTSIFPLNINNATVHRRGKRLLDNVTTEFFAKGTTVIMGPNGSGKTTLLKLIHGLMNAREGDVNWNENSDDPHAEQSFVFQTPIIMRRTVLQNVAYPLRVKGRSSRKAKKIAQDWIEKVGLSGFENRDAARLSGGEKQKMAIARSLSTQPQLLILDEPTTNLDGRSTREIESILVSAREQGQRIIMATHDIGQAKRLATDVRFLVGGRLIEESPGAIFFDHPQTREAKAYLRGDIIE